MRSLLLVALTACSSSASSGKFAIDGNISGAPPPTGTVVFVWDTTQQLYKWGDGTSTAGNYSVSLDPVPPKDAFITMTGVAVGYPVLVDATATVPDGPYMLDSTQRLGLATNYAVIYKSSTVETNANFPWIDMFGASYSCAMCVKGGNGGNLDSWQLTPCANVQIVIGAGDGEICRWK